MYKNFENVFNYPSPDAKASPSPSSGEGLHRCGRGANSFGRSMIEMLGVLAIIAVLSVGGIAGYSKAMRMWRINKSIGEYSYFITGLLEYKDNLTKNADTANKEFSTIEFAEAANLIPATWKQISNIFVTDTFGYNIKPYINTQNKHLVIDIYMITSETAASASETVQFCTKLFTNIAKPLSSTLTAAFTFSGKNSYSSISFKGSRFCDSGETCLQNATLNQLQAACSECIHTSDGQCGFVMGFD